MNSLLCRDSLLSCSQPTQSKPYFDDRIEFENPGVLIPGLSLDDLPRGISRLRNRVISRVFRELGLIEQWGSGIPVILEEAASQHLPPPLFEEVGLRFRVTQQRPVEWCKSPGPPRRLSQHGGRISGVWLRLVLQEVGRSVSLVRVLPQPDEPCPRPIVPHLSWHRYWMAALPGN